MSRLLLHRCFAPEPNEVVRDVSIAELEKRWPEKNEVFYVRVSPEEVRPRNVLHPGTADVVRPPAWHALRFNRRHWTVEISPNNGESFPQSVCWEDAPYVAAQQIRARAGLYIVGYQDVYYVDGPHGGGIFADTPGIHAAAQNLLAIVPMLDRKGDGDHAIAMRIRRLYFNFVCAAKCPILEAEKLERIRAYDELVRLILRHEGAVEFRVVR